MSGSPVDPPRVLGRYALYDAIATGGMATVHLGRMIGPVGFTRTVAIKRLHPHYAADPQILATLLDEARLVARIRHPNVVPTLDVVAEEGELVLVMEYVQGESLAGLIRMTRDRGASIRPEIAATLLAGVLHGLHAAHEARDEQGESLGIIHRDVSPQNVLVGIDGVPRVVDFGVAKAAVRVGESTGDGQLKGKLAYMPPEQTRGVLGRTTDVYAASVVLWETLAGKRLFTGDNNMEIFGKIMEGRIDPPSKYAPNLPPALDAITLRGLSSDPAERYQTAREMARALEDAVPMVTASKIGEWVEAEARVALHERASRIAAIESTSALPTPSREELSSYPSFSAKQTFQRITGSAGSGPGLPVPVTEGPSTELSSIGTAPNMAALNRARSRRGLALGAGAGGLVLLVALVSFGPKLYSSASSAGHDNGGAATPSPGTRPDLPPVVPSPLDSAKLNTADPLRDAGGLATGPQAHPTAAASQPQHPPAPAAPSALSPPRHRPSKSNDVYDHM